jgi:protein-tyrosine phosphatase
MEALSNLNFRDVGGIPVQGGTLRRGVVYRCEGPASFNDQHRAALAGIGFRTICDLRSQVEHHAAPNTWAGGARLVNFDVIADLRAQRAESWDALRASPTAEGAREAMRRNYRVMPEAFLPHLAGFIDLLASRETPVLVHCTAGKDRTGVMIALLLTYLGASEADIRSDYLLSACFGERPGNGASIVARFLSTVGQEPDAAIMTAVLGVDASYLDAALDAVTANWGSVDAYFAAAGIDRSRRNDLVGVLVEPA